MKLGSWRYFMDSNGNDRQVAVTRPNFSFVKRGSYINLGSEKRAYTFTVLSDLNSPFCATVTGTGLYR